MGHQHCVFVIKHLEDAEKHKGEKSLCDHQASLEGGRRGVEGERERQRGEPCPVPAPPSLYLFLFFQLTVKSDALLWSPGYWSILFV